MSKCSLSTLSKGMRAKVVGYTAGHPGYRAKLLALGVTRGTVIEIVNLAPLGDPIEIEVRGFSLSLRKAEATVVEVIPL